mmetsp:Transcript_20882/g.51193  ORF Transcript_20882/g.51193 Transcript_20882/m.51193 type:complete len:366 (+) Transcript_20882:406-1503(+)
MKRLNDHGIKFPLPLQSLIIPNLIKGKDIICVAKTGSGKTLCFIIPVIYRLNFHIKNNYIKTLVISPTRELTQQIGRELYCLVSGSDINIGCVYGGSEMKPFLNTGLESTSIIVTTPGKLIEISGQNKGLKFWNIQYFVIDEADKIFDLGFEFQIKRILVNTRIDCQFSLYTSFLSSKIEEQLNYFLKLPIRFKVGSTHSLNPLVSQFFELTQKDKKYRRLVEILSFWYDLGKTIIFVNEFKELVTLKDNLLKEGYRTLILHSKTSNIDRIISIYSFRNSIINILLSTSIGSRGLDFKNLNLVINYNVPKTIHEYINRIGRTGRNGKHGTSITFFLHEERSYLDSVFKKIVQSNAGFHNISLLIR